MGGRAWRGGEGRRAAACHGGWARGAPTPPLGSTQGFSTLFDLDAAGHDCEYTIDATYKCGVARFLNHSCEPNLGQYSVWVDNVSAALPRIAFFALRPIEVFEELTFDYKYEAGGHKLECQCGAPTCRKWLY